MVSMKKAMRLENSWKFNCQAGTTNSESKRQSEEMRVQNLDTNHAKSFSANRKCFCTI